MRFQKILFSTLQLIVGLYLLLPTAAFAHLISIAATSPFPSQVNASSTTTASYTVTNITSRTPLTIVDQSQLPSGLSISNSTCGSLMNPGQSCVITLQLQAPAQAQTISTELRENASPSADGVKFPIVVSIIASPGSTQFTITPSAGANGAISPNTPQTVNSGASLAFTATPASSYSVNQWLVDGTAVQTGGASYTLTNITANHGIQVTFAGSQVLTAAGQDSTGSQPPLLADSTDGGNTWATKTVTGLPTTGYFLAASCTGSGSSAICTAAGQDNTGSSPPLLASSTDGGNTWATKTVTGLSTSGFFNAASCTGSGSNAICTAVGQDTISGQSPLLVISTDGGNTWATKNVTGLPTSGNFSATSCTGSGSSAICTAVGNDITSNTPLLAISTDGGNTWATKTVTGLPIAGTFSGTSCIGSGSSAICTAAGGGGGPLLAISTDGGNTWARKTVTGITPSGYFNASSCTGSGSSAVCTAVGTGTTGSQPPLLAISTDGGNTWAAKPVTGLPISGTFYGSSCTGSGSSAICTAVGQDNTGSQPPLLAISTDGGNTWATKTVTGISTSGAFDAASCTGSGSSAICTAVGQDYTGSQPPLLAISTDGGNTWAIKTIIGTPTSGAFSGSAATGGT